MFDHLARLHIIRQLLARAAHDPDDPALFDGVADLERLFPNRTDIYAVLRSRWNTLLHTALDEAAVDGRSEVQACEHLNTEHPALRALLTRLRNESASGPTALTVHRSDPATTPYC